MSKTRVDLVLEALRLEVVKRRGPRAWIWCPFHEGDAKSPTFFVRTSGDRRGTIHCFSCKAGGSLVDLVMRVRGIEDREEARALVRDAGLRWEPPRRRVSVVERPPLLARRRFAMPPEVVLGEPLAAWVTPARRYAEARGIGQADVELLGLGYSVDGTLGCRVVFPTRAPPRGEPVSYSARSFTDEEPKYMTPPEADGPDLDAMFGEHLWPAPGARKVVAVTEGSLDAMSVLKVSGVPVGALGGSDVRPGHVMSLATFEHVVILTDDDDPGNRAARALASSLGRGPATTRVRLPADANKLLTTDPGRLREEIRRALARKAP